MSFNQKKADVAAKLLDAIDEALRVPTSKNPEHLVLLAEAFAHVAEHGRTAPEDRKKAHATVL